MIDYKKAKTLKAVTEQLGDCDRNGFKDVSADTDTIGTLARGETSPGYIIKAEGGLSVRLIIWRQNSAECTRRFSVGLMAETGAQPSYEVPGPHAYEVGGSRNAHHPDAWEGRSGYWPIFGCQEERLLFNLHRFSYRVHSRYFPLQLPLAGFGGPG